MNYLREINAFYDWLETNQLSDSAIALWHALMHINNKSGWIQEFAVAISTLEAKTGLKKDAILRARHRLQQLKRIDFKSRSGQQSALYTIIPYEGSIAKYDTNHNTNRELTATQSTTQTATQTASIIKLNETKQDKEQIDTPAGKVLDAYYEIRGTTSLQVSSLESQKGITHIQGLIQQGIDAEFIIHAMQRLSSERGAKSINYFVKAIPDMWAKSQSEMGQREVAAAAASAPAYSDEVPDSVARVMRKRRGAANAVTS